MGVGTKLFMNASVANVCPLTQTLGFSIQQKFLGFSTKTTRPTWKLRRKSYVNTVYLNNVFIF